ncbi:MAG: alkaline phosphatase family protein [Roseobacter sp.]|jgi:hypothetical protein|nr:alkaline phosphatase family protein [Roseobacter sp.]
MKPLLSLALCATILPLAAKAQERPHLILQITVDQLRVDLPLRYFDQSGEGGFLYTMENGFLCGNAHHAHVKTETVVGRATLATGAHPAAHGMVGNLWFDRTVGRAVYNIEDPDYPRLSGGVGIDAKTEIDPTQKAAGTDGRSPSAILTVTFSDALSIATQGRAKAFGVSVKGRGAVTMPGHTGHAFWLSKATGEIVTSTYNYNDYPDWLMAWNEKDFTQRYRGGVWEFLHPIESYVFGERDEQDWEPDFAGFGRTFPHPLSSIDPQGVDADPYFTKFLTRSPAGDKITADLANTLLQQGACCLKSWGSTYTNATKPIGKRYDLDPAPIIEMKPEGEKANV